MELGEEDVLVHFDITGAFMEWDRHGFPLGLRVTFLVSAWDTLFQCSIV